MTNQTWVFTEMVKTFMKNDIGKDWMIALMVNHHEWPLFTVIEVSRMNDWPAFAIDNPLLPIIKPFSNVGVLGCGSWTVMQRLDMLVCEDNH